MKNNKKAKKERKIKALTVSTATFDPLYFRPAEFAKTFNKLKGMKFGGVVVHEQVGRVDYVLEFKFIN